MLMNKKSKTAFFCSQCGAQHPRWQGQCRECAGWNTLIEERAPDKRKAGTKGGKIEVQTIAQITGEVLTGYPSGISEFDRVLGGSLLPGMAVLLGGDPGIGKSTLMLQAAEAYSRKGLPVLYVTGEESLSQIKMRSGRLNVIGERVTVVNVTALDEILEVIRAGDYSIVLIDSIQTVTSSQFDSPPGTVAQIREAANALVNEAKARGFALFLVGHVTKEGLVAGPKVLEHMVDTVIYFEGDTTHLYRMLRATKNRFGSVSEVGLFEMGPNGLVEVANPSAFFLSGHVDQPRSGSVVSAVVEGNRPLLVEVQALVGKGSYGNPQRVAGGIDAKKLALLLAILEKRCDFPVSNYDVFVSVAGGLRVTEPALDLAVLTAIASSLLDRSVDSRLLAVGEVGLSGEVRGVTHCDRRVAEAVRLGFDTILIPAANESQIQEKSARIVPVTNLQLALDIALG